MSKPTTKAVSFVCIVQPFNIQIMIFENCVDMDEYYKSFKDWDMDAADDAGPSHGSYHIYVDKEGITWYNLVLPKAVAAKTVVHECSHAIDFIMEDVGVPISIENTEIRAYLLASLFEVVSAGILERDAS